MLANNTLYGALPVKNLDESMKFYGNILGMQVIDQNENGVWYQSGSSRFVIYESEFAGTNKGTAAIWEVLDIENTVSSLQARGIKFEKFDLPGAKHEGPVHIMGAFKAVWFKDPSGNIICVSHHL